MLNKTLAYAPNDLSPTVLLVEDDHIATLCTKAILDQLGYQSIIAASGEEALEIAKKEHYHFILTDLGLPKMSGEHFIQCIREWEQAIGKQPVPIIVLTGHGDPSITQACLTIGANQVLIKPLNVRILKGTIKAIFKNNNDTARCVCTL